MKNLIRAVAGMLALAVAMEAGANCVGDLNSNLGDGRVDGSDLAALLASWGPRTSNWMSIAADIDGDGLIDGSDLALLLGNWGDCPPGWWGTALEVLPDASVVTDPELRAEIESTGLAWRVLDDRTGIEMLLVPDGTFTMGCLVRSDLFDCLQAEQPSHEVTLTRPFYLGRYEVTQTQFQAHMWGSNPSYFQGRTDSPNRPVEQVYWTLIQLFLANTGFRLPTEAEWEFACRAGTDTPFYNGSTDDSSVSEIAWLSANAGGETHPVGLKQPNALGFFDMLGNVWECVSDWIGAYSEDYQIDPTGPAIGSSRVVRGGSWANDSGAARCSARGGASPNGYYLNLGFRVARNP
jgi:formylglycine-generating enzyme required for sulfatase activity